MHEALYFVKSTLLDQRFRDHILPGSHGHQAALVALSTEVVTQVSSAAPTCYTKMLASQGQAFFRNCLDTLRPGEVELSSSQKLEVCVQCGQTRPEACNDRAEVQSKPRDSEQATENPDPEGP